MLLLYLIRCVEAPQRGNIGQVRWIVHFADLLDLVGSEFEAELGVFLPIRLIQAVNALGAG